MYRGYREQPGEKGDITDMAGQEQACSPVQAELQQIIRRGVQQEAGEADPASGIQANGRDQRQHGGAEGAQHLV